MKKILLGTTALIAMGLVSSQAVAADKIALGLGGFMKQYVAVADQDRTSAASQGDQLSQYGNTEVYFSGSTALDNGLTVAVKVEMEADRNNDNTDVSQLTVSSDQFGQLLLGGDAGAANKFATLGPNVGPLDQNDVYAWASTGSTGAVGAESFATDASSDKANKIRYISPTFSGVAVAASYTPSVGVANDQVLTAGEGTTTNSAAELALKYTGEFSGVGVTFDISRQNREDNSDITRGGLSLAMGGFTVGGSYGTASNDELAGATASLDAKGYEVGVGYKTGPYSFAINMMKAELTGNIANTKDETSKTWRVGGAYDMGAGVTLVGQYAKGKLQDDNTTLTDGNAPSVFIAGIEVAF